MINRKIVLGTAMFGLLAIVTVVAVTSQLVKSQTPTAPSTIPNTNVNFTQIFKEKIKDQYVNVDVRVIYQSPSTVVLEGDKITLLLEDNQFIWHAVDLVKQQGYVIDSAALGH